MLWIIYILATVGAAVAVVGAIAFCAMAYDNFLDWRRAPHQQSLYEGTKKVYDRLAQDAYWFSESPETMALLQDLAHGVDVSSARVKWRAARENVTNSAEEFGKSVTSEY